MTGWKWTCLGFGLLFAVYTTLGLGIAVAPDVPWYARIFGALMAVYNGLIVRNVVKHWKDFD